MRNLTFPACKWFTIAWLFTCTAAHGNTYYISSSDGDDNRTTQQAQQPSTPWQSLNRLNQFFSSLLPGDSILFKRGDTFRGYLQVSISGSNASPVVLSAYGTGTDPVISGFSTVTNWSAAGNGTWTAPLPAAPAMVYTMLVNGVPEPIGRYPNADGPNSGYLSIAAVPSAGIITAQPLPGGDWSEADVVIRKNHWVLDRDQVTSIASTNIHYHSSSGYSPAAGNGYFLQNVAAALDHAHEWYYNKATHTIGMYFGSGGIAATTVEAGTVEELVRISGQSNLTFTGIAFKGANTYLFNIDNASRISIHNCSLLYAGNTAVHATQSQYITINNTVIDHSNNIACDISNTAYLVLSNNTISNTGMIPGSGLGDSGSYEALLLSGDNQAVEGNTILNTGYIPITFNGNALSIKNNFINAFGTVKDDGGGIYTWNNTSSPPVHYNRVIDGNIILNGAGAPDGTGDGNRLMHGIYMDDNADHVTIKNNSVAWCAQYGIFIHNAHDLVADSNTLFSNQAQTAMVHDNIAASIPVTNITFTNNINFSRTASQSAIVFNSIADDLPNIGNLDYNFYCRPLDEQSPITASWKSGWGYYDIAGWQKQFNYDLHSAKSPVPVAPYRIVQLNGNNLYSNGSFNSNINSLYAFAAAGNCSATWANSSPLDAGALKISFNSVTGNSNHGSVIIGIGALVAGHHYILRYDVSGAGNRYIQSYLRQSLSPYSDLSARMLSLVSTARTSCEVLFTATAASDNASIGLDINEQANALYIDNLQLYDADVTITNPDDSIRFIYNNGSQPASFSLNGGYTDVRKMYIPAASVYLPSVLLYLSKNHW